MPSSTCPGHGITSLKPKRMQEGEKFKVCTYQGRAVSRGYMRTCLKTTTNKSPTVSPCKIKSQFSMWHGTWGRPPPSCALLFLSPGISAALITWHFVFSPSYCFLLLIPLPGTTSLWVLNCWVHLSRTCFRDWEMVQWIKCLPHKHGDLSLDPITHMRTKHSGSCLSL